MKGILAGLGTISLVLNVSAPLLLKAAEPPPVNLAENLPAPLNADFNYYFSLCEVLRNQQKYEEALSACDQAISLKKKRAEVWAFRGDILFHLGQHEQALVSTLTALEQREKYSFALTQKCRILSELGQQDEAITACDRALQVDRDWGESSPALTWVTRALAWERQQKYPEALESLEEGLKRQAQYSLALTNQCRVLSETGKYQAAIATCDRALQANNNWGESSPAQAWFLRGLTFNRWGKSEQVLESCSQTIVIWKIPNAVGTECLQKTRQAKLEAAINSYERAVALNPKFVKAWTYQGLNLNELNRHTQARNAFESALKTSPNYALGLVNLCATLNKLGNYQEALTTCEKALQADGQWEQSGPADAFMQRGQALAGLGRYEEALASLAQALSLKPDWVLAWNAKSVILWQAQNYPEALQASDRVIELDPNYFQGWFNRGGIFRALQRNQEAIAAYDRAIASEVSLVSPAAIASVWANRSAVLWHLEQYKEAINSANKALSLDPNSVPAWFNRAISLESLSQYEEAINSYQQALRLDPKQVNVWVAQGMVFFRLKRYKEALNAFDQALQVNPNYTPAIQNRDSLLEQLGRGWQQISPLREGKETRRM